MTPQELKSSILQLAVQGRLVEQRPEEGTAEELYRQIQEEKHRLIKEGKIKKEKPLPEITEDEVPFDIPESWKWVRIGSLSSLVTKGTTPRGGNVSYCNSGVGFLRAENVAGIDRLDTSNLKHIDTDTHNGFLKRSIIKADDVLVTIAGTLGRTAIVRENDLPLNANQAVAIIRLVEATLVDLLFLVYALNASTVNRYLTKQRKVTAIPNLTLEIIENCLIPLPPLAEQKRIVAKIEELLPYIDRYEKSWGKLEDFNKRFPGDMQKSVLQMAIQGKLVEQRPEEGTGEELYRQIQAEKQRLIKEGKIKKEKPLPEITEDEILYDIPETWCLCKLATVSSKITDGEPKTPKRISSFCGYYLLSARNVRDGFISLCDVDYVDQEEYIAISTRCNPQKGDVLISCSGSVGRCAVVTDDNNYVMVRSAAMVAPVMIDSNYLMFTIQSEYVQAQIRNKTKQTAQANLFQGAINNLVVPLPPLAEQKRIVQKLEKILPLCERLK